MCGRYTQTRPLKELEADLMDMDITYDPAPRYNIAPMQKAVIGILAGRTVRAGPANWGLLPSWAEDKGLASKLINARSETVDEKPSFRSALAKRRCLVFADGFFEWARRGSSAKQPFYIRKQEPGLFAFAGLWEPAHPTLGNQSATFTILTTTPNSIMKPIHNRMPVILGSDHFKAWLNDGNDASVREELCRPYPDDLLTACTVSTKVNSPVTDDPACIEPCAAERQDPELFQDL